MYKGYAYRGYRIIPATNYLADLRCWSLELDIEEEIGGELRVRKYHAGNTFETRQEAVYRCVQFGRQIIDDLSPSKG